MRNRACSSLSSIQLPIARRGGKSAPSATYIVDWYRSLPKTISLLHHEFDAVNLRHVNKVGENSHPNGIAFLIGEIVWKISQNNIPFRQAHNWYGQGNIWNGQRISRLEWDTCLRSILRWRPFYSQGVHKSAYFYLPIALCDPLLLDNNWCMLPYLSPISEIFQIGYKSLIAEDWAMGVFNFPNCKGFNRAPVTHYMRWKRREAVVK